MKDLPSTLHSWLNGLSALTLTEIHTAENLFQSTLLNQYADGVITKNETNDAWKEWTKLKAEEIAYLES